MIEEVTLNSCVAGPLGTIELRSIYDARLADEQVKARRKLARSATSIALVALVAD